MEWLVPLHDLPHRLRQEMHGVLAHDELYTRLQVSTVTQAVAAGWIEVYATVAGSKLRRSAG
jgi:hypothetical protein